MDDDDDRTGDAPTCPRCGGEPADRGGRPWCAACQLPVKAGTVFEEWAPAKANEQVEE